MCQKVRWNSNAYSPYHIILIHASGVGCRIDGVYADFPERRVDRARSASVLSLLRDTTRIRLESQNAEGNEKKMPIRPTDQSSGGQTWHVLQAVGSAHSDVGFSIRILLPKVRQSYAYPASYVRMLSACYAGGPLAACMHGLWEIGRPMRCCLLVSDMLQ